MEQLSPQELTVSQAAKRFNISGGRIRQLILSGTLSARKASHAIMGDYWLVDVESLKKYAESKPNHGKRKAKEGETNATNER